MPAGLYIVSLLSDDREILKAKVVKY